MQATAITQNPYGTAHQFVKWSNDAYEDTWHNNLPNEPLEPAPIGLCKAVSDYPSLVLSVYD